MRRSIAAVALLPLLLVACAEPPPDREALCAMALEQVRPRVPEGMLDSGLTCLEAAADGKAGSGQARVALSTLAAAEGGARTAESRRFAVPFQRGEQGWEAAEPKPLGEVITVVVPPGAPIPDDEDPTRLAGDVSIPEAIGAWQVPWVWFALPLEPGGEVDRAWALGLADRARLEAPAGAAVAEDSLDARIAAAAVGVVADIDRLERQGGSVFGSTDGPRWSSETSWLLRDAPGLAAVTVTADGLWLGATPLAGLSGGRLHDGALRGQLVGPLYDALNELMTGIRRAEDLSRQDLLHGRLLVIAGAEVPADTLHRIAFTAGQARFGDLFLLVRDEEPTPVHEAAASLHAKGVSVVLEQEPGKVLGARRGSTPLANDDPAGFVRRQGPAGVIASSRGVRAAAVAGLLDAAHAGKPGCVAWHAPIPEPPAEGAAPVLPEPRPLPPTPDVVSVLPWVLPTIGSGPCSTESRSGGGLELAAGGPTILGTLDEAAVRSVVDADRSALRTCQRSGLARGLGAATVTVKFVVSTSGSVNSARIRSSTLGDERVEQCILERFSRMRFPPPPGGGITIVHWPLELGR